MKPFQFVQPSSIDAAIQTIAQGDAMWLAGGTTMVDLMKLNVLAPATVVSVKPLLDVQIRDQSDAIYIGAGCTMAQLADDPLIKQHLPLVRQSLLLAASPQIRNMATIAGNLLQRTRSPYFRHIDFPTTFAEQNADANLLKAKSLGIDSSMMAVLGNSGQLVGTYPGDFGVAFIAASGTVHVRGAAGERSIAAREFFSPSLTPATYQTALKPDEIIVGLSIPKTGALAHSLYLKIRDRSSYAFALASAAVGLQLDGQGTQAKIVSCCVGLGGVATTPWASPEAEKALQGRQATDDVFENAAVVALTRAVPPEGLEWKVTLAKRVLVRALQSLRDHGVPSDRDIWSYQHGRMA